MSILNIHAHLEGEYKSNACSSSLNLYIVQRVQCMENQTLAKSKQSKGKPNFYCSFSKIRCSLSNDSRAIEGTHEFSDTLKYNKYKIPTYIGSSSMLVCCTLTPIMLRHKIL
ncbi:hypothetical protein SCA6_009498 [Theobroma cacao]